MLDFIGKYFLLGNNHSNGDYIVFFLVLAFIFCVSLMAAMLIDYENYELLTISKFAITLSGVAFFLFLIWLFVGESTAWSEPIGDWVQRRC